MFEIVFIHFHLQQLIKAKTKIVFRFVLSITTAVYVQFVFIDQLTKCFNGLHFYESVADERNKKLLNCHKHASVHVDGGIYILTFISAGSAVYIVSFVYTPATRGIQYRYVKL